MMLWGDMLAQLFPEGIGKCQNTFPVHHDGHFCRVNHKPKSILGFYNCQCTFSCTLIWLWSKRTCTGALAEQGRCKTQLLAVMNQFVEQIKVPKVNIQLATIPFTERRNSSTAWQSAFQFPGNAGTLSRWPTKRKKETIICNCQLASKSVAWAPPFKMQFPLSSFGESFESNLITTFSLSCVLVFV